MKFLIFPFILIIFVLGCTQRPSREKFPGPQGRTTDIQQAEATQAVLGGFDPTRNITADNAPAGGKTSVKGRVTVSPKAQGRVKSGMYFFIAARSPDGGPPLAVKRLQNVKFPFDFVLSEVDAMIPGRVIRGKVQITARLKKSSDPLAQDEGDLFGMIDAEAGQENLKIILE